MRDCPDNIIFIGFASTGKTASGRICAALLGVDFIDLDDRVEAAHLADKGVGRKCREIYSLFGRDCFVRYERKALKMLSGIDRSVISVGGGTPIDAEARDLIRNLGRPVYLKASPEVVFERMKLKGFPKYLGDSPTPKDVAVLMAARHPIYLETADVTVDNSVLSPERTAKSVIAALLEAGFSVPNLSEELKESLS